MQLLLAAGDWPDGVQRLEPHPVQARSIDINTQNIRVCSESRTYYAPPLTAAVLVEPQA